MLASKSIDIESLVSIYLDLVALCSRGESCAVGNKQDLHSKLQTLLFSIVRSNLESERSQKASEEGAVMESWHYNWTCRRCSFGASVGSKQCVYCEARDETPSVKTIAKVLSAIDLIACISRSGEQTTQQECQGTESAHYLQEEDTTLILRLSNESCSELLRIVSYKLLLDLAELGMIESSLVQENFSEERD